MNFAFRCGMVLGILGVLFWSDARAILLAACCGVIPAEERVEVQGEEPKVDARTRQELERAAARREFERLRQQNLAEAEADGNWRTSANQEADADNARREHQRSVERAREEQNSRRTGSVTVIRSGGSGRTPGQR